MLDKFPRIATSLSILGNIVMAIVFMLLGPAYIKIEPSDQLIYGMTCLSGLGYTLVMVSTFRRCQSATVKLGFVDDMKTKILITGATSWQTTQSSWSHATMWRSLR